jgi:hypothetical protein
LPGPPGISEYEIVTRLFDAPGPAGTIASGRTPCPEGKRVVGGGYQAAPPGIEDQVPLASTPESTSRAWNAWVLNTSDEDTLFFVSAICVAVEE